MRTIFSGTHILRSFGLFVGVFALCYPFVSYANNEKHPFSGLVFEQNIGHMNPQTKFVARGHGFNAYFEDGKVYFAISPPRKNSATIEEVGNDLSPTIFSIEFPSVDSNGKLMGNDKLPLEVSSFVGEESRWRRNIPIYKEVRWREIVPHVDLLFLEGADGQLRFDFQAGPGADVDGIKFFIKDVDMVSKAVDGSLSIEVGGATFSLQAPITYEKDDPTFKIPSSFTVEENVGKFDVAFQLGHYDKSKAIVIDPTLDLSLFVGGPSADHGYGVAYGGSSVGVAICGSTMSSSFPFVTTVGALSGTWDAFVAHAGKVLYYGGSGDEEARDLRITSNTAYVVGWTTSSNLPLVNQLLPHRGGRDAFIAAFPLSFSSIFFSTYLGGSSDDQAYGMDLRNGQIYVTGTTTSNNFPVTGTTPPYQASRAGDYDAWVARITTSGFTYAYGTYFGGTSLDQAYSIRADGSNNCYIVGGTQSSNLPTASAFQGANGGGRDGFIAKLSGCGTSLSFSTYWGGSGYDALYHVALDGSGNVYVAGESGSSGLATAGAFQTANNGAQDVYLGKFSSLGARLWSTYIGGSSNDAPGGLDAETSSGFVWVVGETASSNFPANSWGTPLTNTYNGGATDGFVARFNTTGGRHFSGYMGGSGADSIQKIVAIPFVGGSPVAFTGYSDSANFPSTNPSGKSGGVDAIVAVIYP